MSEATQTKPKFTPGPWREDGTGNLVGSNGKRVLVYGLHCAMAMCDPTPEERANAVLMEAAPEMYEALKMFVAAGAPVGTFGDVAYEKGLAAIAKVEGSAK